MDKTFHAIFMEKTYSVPLLFLVRAAGVGAILKKIINGEMKVPDSMLAENMISDIDQMIDGLSELIPVQDLIEAEKKYFGKQSIFLN